MSFVACFANSTEFNNMLPQAKSTKSDRQLAMLAQHPRRAKMKVGYLTQCSLSWLQIPILSVSLLERLKDGFSCQNDVFSAVDGVGLPLSELHIQREKERKREREREKGGEREGKGGRERERGERGRGRKRDRYMQTIFKLIFSLHKQLLHNQRDRKNMSIPSHFTIGLTLEDINPFIPSHFTIGLTLEDINPFIDLERGAMSTLSKYSKRRILHQPQSPVSFEEMQTNGRSRDTFPQMFIIK